MYLHLKPPEQSLTSGTEFRLPEPCSGFPNQNLSKTNLKTPGQLKTGDRLSKPIAKILNLFGETANKVEITAQVTCKADRGSDVTSLKKKLYRKRSLMHFT